MTKQAGLNITLLKEKSNVLQNLLKRYSVNEEDASTSLKELQPIFDLIAKDQIASPYAKAPPCGYYFHEGSLRRFPDLDEAFSEFSMSLQGRDASSLAALLKKPAP